MKALRVASIDLAALSGAHAAAWSPRCRVRSPAAAGIGASRRRAARSRRRCCSTCRRQTSHRGRVPQRCGRARGTGGPGCATREHGVRAHRQRHRPNAPTVGEYRERPAALLAEWARTHETSERPPNRFDSVVDLASHVRWTRRAYDGSTVGRRRRSNARQPRCSPSSARDGDTRSRAWRNCSGHKGDLMLTHYARSFARVGECRRASTSSRCPSFSNPAPRTSPSSNSASTSTRRRFTPSCATAGSSRTPRIGNAAFDAMLDEAAANRVTRRAVGNAFRAAVTRVSIR